MRSVVLPLALCVSAPAAAQTFSGPAAVIDGDTLDMSGTRIRLFGIDAPESMQTCQRGGEQWRCGQDARALLAGMVGTRTLSCTARDRDHYGRIVATCRAGDTDLSAFMAREGFAVALPQFTTDYLDLEARAKKFRLALWGSTFQVPADFRHANPALFAPPVSKAGPEPRRAAAAKGVAAAAGWSYRNCAQARAAGAAPLHRGQPGYGAHIDGDGDGIACEPYRGG